jgi:hypothetical protein
VFGVARPLSTKPLICGIALIKADLVSKNSGKTSFGACPDDGLNGTAEGPCIACSALTKRVRSLKQGFSAQPHSLSGRNGMTKKPKTIKHGRVKKIIKPPHPSMPEKAEVEVHEADDLYKEIRIENKLEDEHGNKVKLKEDAPVDITVEADKTATTPDIDGKAQH